MASALPHKARLQKGIRHINNDVLNLVAKHTRVNVWVIACLKHFAVEAV
jgi:hypothetical protein